MLPAPSESVAVIVSGARDKDFVPFDYRAARERRESLWLKVTWSTNAAPEQTVALTARHGRHVKLRVFARGAQRADMLPSVATQPRFRAIVDSVYALSAETAAADSLYVRVAFEGIGSEQLQFRMEPLSEALRRGSAHARMIATAFGALFALAIAGFIIWFVLKDRIFLLYAALFSLQAIYIAYLSGQGFEWPGFSAARALTSHTWNIPAAVSGAVAALFVREITDLKRYAPGVYQAFGWMAVVFIVIAVANFARDFGFGAAVATVGNLVFLIAALFTLGVAFWAWRRGSRAAGWFLLAWGLLETATIATALRLLVGDGATADLLLYYALPLSMVAAAILAALGVADRLRAQRIAWTDAERRAQTDALTGVLNRSALIERLDAACLRAQARQLPLALLFIDLDHFKRINDTHGHLAGDACLRAIVGPIQAELRQSDAIGRYGGEEFIVILSGADSAIARPIAERIRERVAAVRVAGYGESIALTCSIGVAATDTLGVWGERLIAQADAAVYTAKSAGRNRVEVAERLAA
jgi:diguanylate cyclase (GGDEF)-like protein